MRLGKTVLTKTFNLAKDLARELFLVATLTHASDQFLFKRPQPTTALPRSHGPPQPVGLPRRESCRDNRKLHDLFLEYRHTQRTLQNTFDVLTRIVHRFFAVSPAQVWVHHVTLDRAGTNDRHLDNEVVITTRSQARQHGHLCTRFDLEYTHRVTGTDHVVNKRVLGRYRGQRQRTTVEFTQQIETATNRRQHAEPKHIDLEQTKIFEIGFFPLDDGAVRHRGVLDRHEVR